MKDAYIAFLKSTRWNNLLITVATLFVSYFLLLLPLLSKERIKIHLGLTDFLLLVLSVLLIMSAGYLVNDIEDEVTDEYNKKSKSLLKPFSLKLLYVVYLSITLSGVIIGLYVSLHLGSIQLWSVHLLAALLLFLYAIQLKSTPLAGNLIIALLCGIIPLIPLIFNNLSFTSQMKVPFFIFNFMGIFAFTATIIREIIKDMEDLEGDSMAGLNTFPALFGISATKMIAGMFIALYLLLMLAFAYYFYETSWVCFAYLIVCTIAPMILVSYKLRKATSKLDFQHLSYVMKSILFAGVLFAVVYNYSIL